MNLKTIRRYQVIFLNDKAKVSCRMVPYYYDNPPYYTTRKKAIDAMRESLCQEMNRGLGQLGVYRQQLKSLEQL